MKYLFRVTGLVVVEAPNVAQAAKYVRGPQGPDGDKHRRVRISAGGASYCHSERGRNIHIGQYLREVRSMPETERIEYVGRAEG